jgi:hypothetical protein
MADIQNVTLVGGVTVGASVDMMISPSAAYALGVMVCTACFTGYRYLAPFLTFRFCHVYSRSPSTALDFASLFIITHTCHHHYAHLRLMRLTWTPSPS